MSASPFDLVVQESRIASVSDVNRTLGFSTDLSLEYQILIHSHFKAAAGV
ncbi:MAG: hypothetical protein JNM63_16740, partial [Spirochaetia bacterium]|nr:hypothetical protein [Spirochaetia bacterium]